MSLLMDAGIYLVLDVNSPLQNHHLNRYEPWTTYNRGYLENIFKVVEQFSSYNNTLGFFAGNEIINDKVSAKVAPVYVKGVVRDLKNYIHRHSPRAIPVGYSAADDLNYRISLSNYLECVAETPQDSIDFYGVNSYQWCGEQTFQTSGYDALVKDYKAYSRPVFLSEYVFGLFMSVLTFRYGCNEVSPRKFGEVHSIYSNKMVGTFSGGLVYEFTQEPNNYGLVEVLDNDDVRLLGDFHALRAQMNEVPELDYDYVFEVMKSDAKNRKNKSKVQKYEIPYCEELYENLGVSVDLPVSPGEDLINSGVVVERGRYVNLDDSAYTTTHSIFDTKMELHQTPGRVLRISDNINRSKYWHAKYESGEYRSGDLGVLC